MRLPRVALTALVVASVSLLLLVSLARLLPPAPRPSRQEVPSNVDGLKTAELAYDAAFDGFVACGNRTDAERWIARQPSVGRGPLTWLRSRTRFDAGWPAPRAFRDAPGASCFQRTLGWEPDGPVRGAYWVELVDGGFVAHGIVDLDGDGVLAHYTAGNDHNATLWSAPTVQ